jgi:hypothetical protein
MFSLFWSIVMMALILFMFGLCFVQSLTTYFADEGDSVDLVTRDRLLDHFGSVQAAMLSLYKVTTGGDDWSLYYDDAVLIGWMTSGLYLFFVAFTQIALLNILTGLFVENAMKLAEPDRSAEFSEQQRVYARQVKELEGILMEVDLDRSGYISEEEFQSQMREHHSRLRTYLGAAGVHEADAERFFKMLKSANFEQDVLIADFVGGCMKLRGTAQSLDMQALAFEVKNIHKRILDLHREFRRAERYGTLSQASSNFSSTPSPRRLAFGSVVGISPLRGSPMRTRPVSPGSRRKSCLK